MKKVSLSRVGLVVFVAGVIIAFMIAVNLPVSAGEPTVTPVFMFIYGYGPLEVGDVITVSTRCGIVCGKATVTEEGMYGQMAVYGNDTLSDVKDGANFGERLVVRINDWEVFFPAGSEPSFGRDGEIYQVDL